jgi:hypothetical protein
MKWRDLKRRDESGGKWKMGSGVTWSEVKWSEVKWSEDLWWDVCIITDL